MGWNKTDVYYNQGFDKVDKEKGIIKGVSVVRMGIAKGHGVWLDSQFIDKVVEMGSEHEMGLKARFGHPNMCSDALGTFIGRYKNFRRVGDIAVADLHLDESAKISPNGDLYEYVLSMANSNPDMFGTSIVFKAGESYFEEVVNEDEETVTREYATIAELLAADLVDTPAATDSLFSADFTAAKVTTFLDANPEILEVLYKKPEVIEEFLTKYNSYKEKLNKMEKKEQSFSDKVLDVVKGALPKLFTEGTEETTEEVVAETTEETTEETVETPEAVTEETTELSEEETEEAVAHLEEKLEETEEKFEEGVNELEVQFNHVIAEKDEEILKLKSQLEESENKFNELQAKETGLEHFTDPDADGEVKLSESQKALQTLFADIREEAKLRK
jgi:hypothetical protein